MTKQDSQFPNLLHLPTEIQQELKEKIFFKIYLNNTTEENATKANVSIHNFCFAFSLLLFSSGPKA